MINEKNDNTIRVIRGRVIGGDNEYGVIPTKDDILKKLDKLAEAAMSLPYGIQGIISHEVVNKEFMDKFNTKSFAPSFTGLSSGTGPAYEMIGLYWIRPNNIEKINRLLHGRADAGYDIVALKIDAVVAGCLTIGFAKNPSNGMNIDQDVIEAISGFSKFYIDEKQGIDI